MVCTVCFLSWWKIFARGSWNFELVQIFLINWIVSLGTHGLHCLFSIVMENSCSRHLEFWACPNILDQLELDCFVRHAWFALSVFFCDGKFLLEAVGILSLFNYSWTIGLQIISFGKHGLQCLFSFMMEFFARGSWNFELVQIFLINWIVFDRHAWFALSVFFRDGKFLLEEVGILSLSKYSWSIGLFL